MFFNTEQAAVWIGISESKLIGWINGSEFKGIKPPKSRILGKNRVRQFELEELLEAKERLNK